jgi:hypothetical protein
LPPAVAAGTHCALSAAFNCGHCRSNSSRAFCSALRQTGDIGRCGLLGRRPATGVDIEIRHPIHRRKREASGHRRADQASAQRRSDQKQHRSLALNLPHQDCGLPDGGWKPPARIPQRPGPFAFESR